jgi:hypothetical protein
MQQKDLAVLHGTGRHLSLWLVDLKIQLPCFQAFCLRIFVPGVPG